MTSQDRTLTASYRPMASIAPNEILQMHGLFTRYYENADAGTFLRDLSKKNGAILVHERGTGTLRGFSTICTVPLWDGEREAIGVFSGDTVMDPAFWGDRALKDGFARFALKLKLTHPTTPVYWLLISKGYKTYLLLANNFTNYYPRHDKPNDPKLKRLVEAYCNKLFPGKYDPEREVLDFGAGYQRLKEDVAPITNEMLLEHPAIRYFERRNPEWRRGVELPCIGEISLSLLCPYLQKQQRKLRGAQQEPEYAATPRRESGFFSSGAEAVRGRIAENDERPLRLVGNE